MLAVFKRALTTDGISTRHVTGLEVSCDVEEFDVLATAHVDVPSCPYDFMMQASTANYQFKK
jgi:hypothetical protein